MNAIFLGRNCRLMGIMDKVPARAIATWRLARPVLVVAGVYKTIEYLAERQDKDLGSSQPGDKADKLPPVPSEWRYGAHPVNMGFARDLRPRNLFQQIERGDVTAQLSAKNFGPKSLILALENKTPRELRVQVPKGTFVGNSSLSAQPLIVCRDNEVSLAPWQSTTKEMDAFCGIRQFSVPKDNRMELSNHVLTAPGALASQKALWKHLRPHYPARPVQVSSSEDSGRYYLANRLRRDFVELEAELQAEAQSSSKWADSFCYEGRRPSVSRAMPANAAGEEGGGGGGSGRRGVGSESGGGSEKGPVAILVDTVSLLLEAGSRGGGGGTGGSSGSVALGPGSDGGDGGVKALPPSSK